jgi:uncharacterized LabA/DUF88 family protein
MKIIPEKKRVIIYVDGFNFYNGLKDKGWRKYYWLDIVSFFEKFIRDDQELVEVNYFSAKSLDKGMADRQDLFFSVNKLNSKFHLFLGKYISKTITCFKCKHKYAKHEEKRTDVSIATHIISNIVKGRCDITILVSADSDLIPPLEFIRETDTSHQIYVYAPPQRYSSDLHKIANNFINLDRYEQRFKQSVFPDEVTLKNGYVAKIPPYWKGTAKK